MLFLIYIRRESIIINSCAQMILQLVQMCLARLSASKLLSISIDLFLNKRYTYLLFKLKILITSKIDFMYRAVASILAGGQLHFKIWPLHLNLDLLVDNFDCTYNRHSLEIPKC